MQSQYARFCVGRACCLLVLLAQSTALAGGDVQAISHSEHIYRGYKKILAAGSREAYVEAHVDYIRYVLTNEVKSQAIAPVLFKFLLENYNPNSFLVVATVKSSPVKVPDLLDVWAAELSSKEEKRRQVAATLLSAFGQGADGQYQLSLFKSAVSKLRGDSLEALVGYLFDIDPGAAVLVVADAKVARRSPRYREILYVHHMIEHSLWLIRMNFPAGRDQAHLDAGKHLPAFVKAEEWWLRLYAAKVMARHNKLRNEELIRALANDESAIVARTVAAFSGNGQTDGGGEGTEEKSAPSQRSE